jgi:hypothetical protein
VLGNLQGIRAGGAECRGGIAVHGLSQRARHVLIDRVVNKLVSKYERIALIAEESRPEGLSQVSNQVRLLATSDRRQVPDRHGVAEHGDNLQQVKSGV